MQKFAGFHPRTRLVRWGLFVVTVGIVVGGTAPQAADMVARALATQHDSLPWYASRLLAFLSYFATAASVIYGLLLSTKLLDVVMHRPISFTLHQDLASFGLGLAGLHAVLLSLDRTDPFTLGQLLVPFASPYRPVWVGLGQLSLYLATIVVGSFYVRRRIGQRAWRLLHGVTFLVFAAATAHGILAGTDTATPWAWWAYVAPTAIVMFLTTYRLLTARSARARAPRPLPASAGVGAASIRQT